MVREWRGAATVNCGEGESNCSGIKSEFHIAVRTELATVYFIGAGVAKIAIKQCASR